MSFKYRSYQQELLDAEDIPFEDIKQNMQELDFINKYLGGHKITLKGIRALANKGPLHIVEIGCGGGDNLRIIKQWCTKRKITVEVTGIDINNECIVFAQNKASNQHINFICNDYRSVQFQTLPDIIFSSLFCHHFQDDDLTEMMRWMRTHSRIGFFINDLHRHPLAYYSIKLLTKAFSKSHLVKHDAPLSVKKGLIKKEWQNIFSKAAIENYQIKWQWAFRWLIISYH